MSSYVINKKEFIKAAGVVAALNEKSNFYGNESGLYLGKFTDNGMSWRLLDKDDFKAMFTRFYELNADSVKKQYNDPEAEADGSTYDDEFNRYYALTSKFIKYGEYNNLERIIYCLLMFSRSLNYQVEDQADKEAIFKDFNEILARSFDLIADRKYKALQMENWGEFNYVSPEEQAAEEKREAERAAIYNAAYYD